MLGRPATRDVNLFFEDEAFFCEKNFLYDRNDRSVALHTGDGHGEYAMTLGNGLDHRVFTEQVFVDGGVARNRMFADVQPSSLDRPHESPHFVKDSCWPYFAAK